MSRRINVTHIRTEMGLSPAEFAERLGVAERSVYRWEAGDVEPSPLAFQQMRREIGQHRAKQTTEVTTVMTSGVPGPGVKG